MPRRKNQNGAVNKSAAIRELLNQNAKTPVKEIMATLAQKGIKVQPSLVYFLKAKMKRQKRRQIRERVAQTTGNGNPVDLILKVKGLAAQAGGMGKLKQLVEVLAE
jgi:hypothetical protein